MLKRFEGNPIIAPIDDHLWECKMVFNTAAILLDDKVHLLYRARDVMEQSRFGYASSSDGFHIDERLTYPVFSPDSKIDCFGCEDPRMTRIGDDIYVTYTAYGIVPRMEKRKMKSIQIGLTSISVDDFLAHKWNWRKRVYPLPGVDNKDSCILPEKFNGKYIIYHRIPPHIWIAYSDDLAHWYDNNIFMSPRGNGWEYFKVGAGGPPLKTEKGWLFIYHAVSADMVYRLGFAFMDLNDPGKITYRHAQPILEPVLEFEKQGVVSNVVFTCGAVLKDDTVFVYYGGADTVIGVATAPLSEFFKLAGL